MSLLKCTMPEKRKTPPSEQGTKMIIKRMQGLDKRKHNHDFYTSLYQELDSQEYVQFHRTQQHRLDTLVTFHHCQVTSPLRTAPIIFHYVPKSVLTLNYFRYNYVLSEPSVWHENWVNPYKRLLYDVCDDLILALKKITYFEIVLLPFKPYNENSLF